MLKLGLAGNLVSLGTDVLMILAVTFFLSVDEKRLNVRILRLMTDTFREHVLFVEHN